MAGSSGADSKDGPLRILMTADAVGGVWQYSVDLVNGLAANGAEVMVAVLGPGPSVQQKAQLESLGRVTLVQGEFALEWMDNPWSEVDAAALWLQSLEKDFRPDVIHLNGYAHAAAGWRKPVLVVAHSCVFSWWRSTIGCTPGPEWEEYRRRVSSGLSACDVLVAPSRFMANEIHRIYGTPESKIRVISNFSVRKANETREKEPFILAAGRVWDRAKNFALLDEIAGTVPWPIYLAGKDEARHVSESNSRSVHKLGQLSNDAVLDYMARAGVFVHPALYEPFGLSVLEAARSRCCLVLSDIPSLRELWGDAAIFVNPRSPQEWVRNLKLVAADPARRAELGEAAAVQARRYKFDDSLGAYQSLYREFLTRYREKSEEAA